MTAHLVVRARTPLQPADALDRLLDLDRHTELVPLTRLIWTRPLTIGSTLTARTSLGPIVVDDVMQVHELGPDHARIVKVGRWIRGTAEISATRGPGEKASTVEWRQSLSIKGIPALFDPVVAAAGKAMYEAIVRSLVRDLGE
ncbi:hypothetical protein [Mariniluteicoccus flavus]